MKPDTKQVLSVSRRTDIPAFYMPWFMQQLDRGYIEVVNPFNRQAKRVTVSPQRVHSMVFWSKNFGPFLDGEYGERLQDMGYHLFFNFTVNSHLPILEPGVPELSLRLDQLREICRRFGGASVQWRFDPVCHFIGGSGGVDDNLADFESIAEVAGDSGVECCITSFMDHYRKIDRRTGSDFTFVEPSTMTKKTILMDMQRRLAPMGIELSACCEKKVLDDLPLGAGIRSGACISARRIMAVHGGQVSARRDHGQRKTAGCGCSISTDVGSYSLHPCYHNCLFCYANPARDQL